MDHQILLKWIASGSTSVSNLLLKHYRQIGLTNDELIFVIQLNSFLDKGIAFPNTNQIAQRMGMDSEKMFGLIHQLIQKKVLEIRTNEDEYGRSKDYYSLDLLWEKLIFYLSQKDNETKKNQSIQNEKELYQMFEEEFGRPLTPIEMQTIGMWLDEDHYSLELIEMALKEAVLNQVYSLKYVDRILLTWEKKNIRTKEQVEKESRNFRNKKISSQHPPANEKPTKAVPLHNWLEDNEENK